MLEQIELPLAGHAADGEQVLARHERNLIQAAHDAAARRRLLPRSVLRPRLQEKQRHAHAVGDDDAEGSISDLALGSVRQVELERLAATDRRHGRAATVPKVQAGIDRHQAWIEPRHGRQIDRRFRFGPRAEVSRDARHRVALHHQPTAVHHHHPLTQVLDAGQVVTHEQHRPTFSRHVAHPTQTLLLEGGVTHRQHFIHQQDLRLQVRGDRERQPQVHAAGVAFDRCIDESLDTCERDHLVEAPRDLGVLHAQDRAVEVDVLASGQLRMEAGADLEQTPNATADFGAALRRLGDARENLQERAFTGPVVADHPEHFARSDLQRHVAQRPDRVVDDVRSPR